MKSRLFFALFLFVGGISSARAEVHLEVTGLACSHVPSADYVEPPGVEYQPGIDANGNPVTPAELGSQIRVPEKFIIPVSDYLYTHLASSAGVTSGALSPQAILGVITYDHGHLTFNGQPLGADVDSDVAQLCRQAENPK